MRWVKKGRIFTADGQFGWMNSHAQVPTALVLEDRIRIYFASRPERTLSLTSFVDVDIDDPGKVLYLHSRPILALGERGMFDEHGIMPSSVCQRDAEVWLYYGGWSRRTSVPYSNWTGLAISDDGGRTFSRGYRGPILDRTPDEVYSATGTFVCGTEGSWHMWYASGMGWVEVDGALEEYYVIKYARSRDGVVWERESRKLLPSRMEYEPTHRPTVVRFDGACHMWFCHRGISDFRNGQNSYRIGYARSQDMRRWERRDELAGIDVSADGWDSRMLAYPYVVEADGRYLMFYNGNGFGASGFGYAELDG